MTIFGTSSKNELIQRILLKFLLQGTPLQEKKKDKEDEKWEKNVKM